MRSAVGAPPLRHRTAHRRRRRRSRTSLCVLAVTAVAFALLVSVAASHLHLTPDADEACSLCAAFAGKVGGPSEYVPTAEASAVMPIAVLIPAWRWLPSAPAHLLPPYCGPPPAA